MYWFVTPKVQNVDYVANATGVYITSGICWLKRTASSGAHGWKRVNGQIFTAVRFSPTDECYERRPMTCRPISRRYVSDLEMGLIKEKEKKTLFKYINKFTKISFY